ncbi:MAG: hypothetical protein P4L69_05935 [Desulfosporosinus sp.]|nr:hypothetical protein [Desulfosporosinus sp.]
MHKVLSVEYEVARQIISNMLQKGLNSKAEFETLDKKNLKILAQTINLLFTQHRAIIRTPGQPTGSNDVFLLEICSSILRFAISTVTERSHI